MKLIDRCVKLTPRSATKEQILTKHTEEQYNILKETSGCENADKLEDLSSHYDAIYIHPVLRFIKATAHRICTNILFFFSDILRFITAFGW